VHTAPTASSISWYPLGSAPSGTTYPIGTISTDGMSMGLALVDLALLFTNSTELNTYLSAITAGTLTSSQLATLQQLLARAARAVDASTWMTDNNALLGPLALNQVAIPGSHDAGMSTLPRCSIGAGSSNTQTQSTNIAGQLAAGSRFFDFRPLLWTSLSPTFYLGHFSQFVGTAWVGCAGQDLGSALSEIAQFLNQPGCEKEIVILNFSHTLSLNDDFEGGGFNEAEWIGLVQAISSALSGYLYTVSASTSIPNLNTVTVNDVIASGRRVIAVFDGIPPDQVAPSDGIFLYADYDSSKPGSLTIYNEYSNTDDVGDMESDQLSKFKQYCKPSSWLFLLSWTMTWKIVGALSTTIESMATTVNFDVNPKLNWAIAQGAIGTGRIPNILYVDYTDPTYNIPSLCLYLTMVNANQVP
jgi:hypothetical protein